MSAGGGGGVAVAGYGGRRTALDAIVVIGSR